MTRSPNTAVNETLENAIEQNLPLIASAVNGLISQDDAIAKTLPQDYVQRKIGEVLDYLLAPQDLQGKQLAIAKSIRTAMKADTYVVNVNGNNAELDDPASRYIAKREHKLQNGEVKAYNALDFDVSEIDELGVYRSMMLT